MNKPVILISNDDGYHAKGIKSLVDMVKDLGEVIVCSPESARSGFSCAFSAVDYLRLKRRHNMGDTEVWSCTGTPVDCVKLALDKLCYGRWPSLVIGGINHGDNSTVNSHYSGTMGVAMEGCMKYIPSIAFSLCDASENADFEPLRGYVRKIVKNVLENGLPKGTCLNVNFPKAQTFKGVRACRMTYGQWVKEVETMQHPRGYEYYWMVGHYRNDEVDAEDTDQWAINHGYVAITPTTMDVTDYKFLENMKSEDFDV
jgi:5'-nucleotidase